MPDKGLMKLMVECPNTYREVHLSDPQIDLYEYVEGEGPVTSNQVAEEFAITVQNASVRLNQLFKKKYLTRKDLGSKTGGPEYHYSAVEL